MTKIQNILHHIKELPQPIAGTKSARNRAKERRRQKNNGFMPNQKLFASARFLRTTIASKTKRKERAH
jgi:hypothetical protein